MGTMGALPEELKTIISEEDFSVILSYAIVHLSNIKRGDIRLVDGILMYEVTGGQQVQTNFINLVKNVLCENKSDWEQRTRDFLDSPRKDVDLIDLFTTDYSKAKDYLTLRLHSQSAYEEGLSHDSLATHIYSTDIPETYTILALDLPNSFHILTREEIAKWGQSEASLFEIARNNVRAKINLLDARKREWNGALIFTIFDGDYSASYCADFKNNCDNLIGEHGSVISFPTKGSVFAHPVSDIRTFNAAFQVLVEQTNKFYTEDPGPITRNIFWYHNGSFIKFQTDDNNGEITYTIPKPLLGVLK